MSVNATTMSSAIDRTADSTAPDQNTVVERIYQATTWINLFEARIAILRAKILKEREAKKSNHTTVKDCTVISQTFYDQVLHLWTAVQNYKIRIQNETNKNYNALAHRLMGQPSPSAEIEDFKRQILELGELITPLYIVQKELAEEKDDLDRKIIEKQKEMIVLIAEVGDKLGQAESQTHPREIQKRTEKLMKIKIGRCIINSILTQSKIDYEQNPDLVDLRIKWQYPISLKSKTT